MLLVDAEAVHRLLDYPSLVEALRQAHRGPVPKSEHLVQDEPENGDNKFVALVGWQKDALIAVKLVGVFPSNHALVPPQPSVQGIVAVFDAMTGKPRLICDGAAITFRKTAADFSARRKLSCTSRCRASCWSSVLAEWRGTSSIPIARFGRRSRGC